MQTTILFFYLHPSKIQSDSSKNPCRLGFLTIRVEGADGLMHRSSWKRVPSQEEILRKLGSSGSPCLGNRSFPLFPSVSWITPVLLAAASYTKGVSWTSLGITSVFPLLFPEYLWENRKYHKEKPYAWWITQSYSWLFSVNLLLVTFWCEKNSGRD